MFNEIMSYNLRNDKLSLLKEIQEVEIKTNLPDKNDKEKMNKNCMFL